MFVLITGGAGFIGRNLITYLQNKGCRIRILDNFSQGTERYIRNLDIEIIQGDVREPTDAARSIVDIDAIVHLAAQASVPASVIDPFFDCQTNIIGTLNMLEAARNAGIPKFVFASSNATLGSQPPPAREDLAARPISPYGASKLAGEGYCQAYNGSFGLQTTIFRFANVYGPFSAHNRSVISLFLSAAQAGQPITIYGDGSQTRDFIFVEDLCAALWAGLIDDAAGEIFQLAMGIETSINSLVAAIGEVTGLQTAVAHANKRAGDIYRNYADISKIERVLSWRPSVPLIEGLKRTWDWFQADFGQ